MDDNLELLIQCNLMWDNDFSHNVCGIVLICCISAAMFNFVLREVIKKHPFSLWWISHVVHTQTSPQLHAKVNTIQMWPLQDSLSSEISQVPIELDAPQQLLAQHLQLSFAFCFSAGELHLSGHVCGGLSQGHPVDRAHLLQSHLRAGLQGFPI